MEIVVRRNEIVITTHYNIDLIEKFIHTHLHEGLSCSDSLITLPKTTHFNPHRYYLLRWIASLYKIRSKYTHSKTVKLQPALDSMKSIKIVKKRRAQKRIFYTFISDDTLKISFAPYNATLVHLLQKRLKKRLTPASRVKISFASKEEKERLCAFLKEEKIERLGYCHIYKKEELRNFLESKTKIDAILDAYKILQLSIYDDLKTVKKRYKELAKQYHPDRILTQDPKTIEYYTKKFQTIFSAYSEVLDNHSLLHNDLLSVEQKYEY